MSVKNQQPSESPQLVSLFDVQRKIRMPPWDIIRRCSGVWLDFTPADERYRWLVSRLVFHKEDSLTPITGNHKLTEDAQEKLAYRLADPFRSSGFPLVSELALETGEGTLVLHSLSNGQCPPIPTPKIMVPQEIFDELSSGEVATSRTNQKGNLGNEDINILLTPLEEVLLRMQKGGLNSEPAIKREINRELGRKMNRTYDFDHILVSWLNSERDSLIWKNGSKEKVYKWKTVVNKISFVRKFFPKTVIS